MIYRHLCHITIWSFVFLIGIAALPALGQARQATMQQIFDDLLLSNGEVDSATGMTNRGAAAQLAGLSDEQLRANLPALTKGLGSTDFIVSTDCATALRRLGAPGASAVIEFVHAHAAADKQVQGQFGEDLGRLGVENLPAVMKLLDDPDPVVQTLGVRGVFNIVGRSKRGKDITPDAIAAIQKALPKIHAIAVPGKLTGMAGFLQDHVGPATAEERAQAWGPLRLPHQDPASHALYVAQAQIAEFKARGPSATPDLVKLLSSDDTTIEDQTLSALLEWYHPDGDGPLYSLDERLGLADPAPKPKPPAGPKYRLAGANRKALVDAGPRLVELAGKFNDNHRVLRMLGLVAADSPQAAGGLIALIKSQGYNNELTDALAAAGPIIRPKLEEMAKVPDPPAPPKNSAPNLPRQRYDPYLYKPSIRVSRTVLAIGMIEQILSTAATRPVSAGEYDHQSIEALVDAMSTPEISRTSAKALVLLGDNSAPQLVDRALTARSENELRNFADALAGADGKQLVALILPHVHDRFERTPAVGLLSIIGPEGTAAMVRLLDDPDAQLRGEIMRQLVPIAPRLATAAPAERDPVVASLSRILNSADGMHNAFVAPALAKIGPSGVAVLAKRLNDADPDVRGAMASYLGQAGPEAFEPLVSLLDDPVSRVRRAAAGSITYLKPSSAPALGKFIQKSHGRGHDIAVAILAQELVSDRTVPADQRGQLLALLPPGAANQTEQQAEAQVNAASGIDIDPTASALAKQFNDPDPKVAMAAVRQMVGLQFEIDDPGALIALLHTARSYPDPAVRKQAGIALDDMYIQVDQRISGVDKVGVRSALVVPPLIKQTKSPASIADRCDALRVLAALAIYTPTALDAYQAAMDDANPQIQLCAVIAVGRTMEHPELMGNSNSRSVAMLAAALQSKDATIRDCGGYELFAHLPVNGVGVALPVLKQMLAGNDRADRGIAAVIIDRTEWSADHKTVTFAQIAEAVRHPSSWVRQSAIRIVQETDSRRPNTVPGRIVLIRALDDADPSVVTDAALSLFADDMQERRNKATVDDWTTRLNTSTGSAHADVVKSLQQHFVDLYKLPDPATLPPVP